MSKIFDQNIKCFERRNNNNNSNNTAATATNNNNNYTIIIIEGRVWNSQTVKILKIEFKKRVIPKANDYGKNFGQKFLSLAYVIFHLLIN